MSTSHGLFNGLVLVLMLLSGLLVVVVGVLLRRHAAYRTKAREQRARLRARLDEERTKADELDRAAGERAGLLETARGELDEARARVERLEAERPAADQLKQDAAERDAELARLHASVQEHQEAGSTQRTELARLESAHKAELERVRAEHSRALGRQREQFDGELTAARATATRTAGTVGTGGGGGGGAQEGIRARRLARAAERARIIEAGWADGTETGPRPATGAGGGTARDGDRAVKAQIHALLEPRGLVEIDEVLHPADWADGGTGPARGTEVWVARSGSADPDSPLLARARRPSAAARRTRTPTQAPTVSAVPAALANDLLADWHHHSERDGEDEGETT